MNLEIINHSSWSEPHLFIEKWMAALTIELGKVNHPVDQQEITVAFIEEKEIRRINREFRGKDKATDILSFEDIEGENLGELALCGEIIANQAKDHNLSFNQELGYLLVHGTLHLIGYEHEQGGESEKKMFALQDQLFDILSTRFF